jgi:hypothetical protein
VKKEFPFSYKFDHWNKVLANAAPLSSAPPLTDSNSSSECSTEFPEPDSPRRRLTIHLHYGIRPVH